MKFNLKDKKFYDQKLYQEDNDYVINKIVSLDRDFLIGSSKTRCSLYGCEYEPLTFIYK